MTTTNLELRSLITEQNTLELSLHESAMPEPKDDEVVVRLEATPINPSDLAVLLGPADMSTARQEGTAEQPKIVADVPANFMNALKARVGKSIPVGNEGAGTVVAAGKSEAAQALLGQVVGIFGGGAYSQYRSVNVQLCLPLLPGTTAEQAASCTVNPMTALAMIETLKMEGHTALVHTAAASNLGQMLNRICIADGIDLVNIVRKPEQEKLLRDMGAKYVVNSSNDSFYSDLTAALIETKATLAFDATGGGKLASDVMACMERAAARNMTEHSVYGSDVHKQLYIYGFLNNSTTTLNSRSFGFKWGIGGFLLTNFFQKAGMERVIAMRTRVAKELTTTFASHYSSEVTLKEALSLEAVQAYSQQATGKKFMIKPQG